MRDERVWTLWLSTLDGLPERVEELRYANALSVREASEQMGVSVGALHSFIHRSGTCTVRTLRRIVEWVEASED